MEKIRGKLLKKELEKAKGPLNQELNQISEKTNSFFSKILKPRYILFSIFGVGYILGIITVLILK